MKIDRSHVRTWIWVAFAALAGFAIYRYIPQYHRASETVTAGIIVLVVLKHVGLFSIFGVPGVAFFRSLRAHFRRRESDRAR